jgi:DNA-binding transcriptional regulator YdaS (Cro superfamily)
MNTTIIKKVVDAAGGTTRLAEILGIRPQAVSQWKVIPVKHVLAIEKALRSKITRYQMRPDIYGEE